MKAPLLITRDENLLDELVRLAAAAGVVPVVASDGLGGLPRWDAAPLVLVGDDVAAELAELRPVRRDGVHVVSWGPLRTRRCRWRWRSAPRTSPGCRSRGSGSSSS